MSTFFVHLLAGKGGHGSPPFGSLRGHRIEPVGARLAAAVAGGDAKSKRSQNVQEASDMTVRDVEIAREPVLWWVRDPGFPVHVAVRDQPRELECDRRDVRRARPIHEGGADLVEIAA